MPLVSSNPNATRGTPGYDSGFQGAGLSGVSGTNTGSSGGGKSNASNSGASKSTSSSSSSASGAERQQERNAQQAANKSSADRAADNARAATDRAQRGIGVSNTGTGPRGPTGPRGETRTNATGMVGQYGTAISHTPQEVERMARAMLAESGTIRNPNGTLNLTAAQAVGHVIANRVTNANFPNTVSGVIDQKKQFSTVGDGTINKVDTSSPEYKAAERIAEQVLNGQLQDVTKGSLNFANIDTVNNKKGYSSTPTKQAFNSMQPRATFTDAQNPNISHTFGTIGNPTTADASHNPVNAARTMAQTASLQAPNYDGRIAALQAAMPNAHASPIPEPMQSSTRSSLAAFNDTGRRLNAAPFEQAPRNPEYDTGKALMDNAWGAVHASMPNADLEPNTPLNAAQPSLSASARPGLSLGASGLNAALNPTPEYVGPTPINTNPTRAQAYAFANTPIGRALYNATTPVRTVAQHPYLTQMFGASQVPDWASTGIAKLNGMRPSQQQIAEAQQRIASGSSQPQPATDQQSVAFNDSGRINAAPFQQVAQSLPAPNVPKTNAAPTPGYVQPHRSPWVGAIGYALAGPVGRYIANNATNNGLPIEPGQQGNQHDQRPLAINRGASTPSPMSLPPPGGTGLPPAQGLTLEQKLALLAQGIDPDTMKKLA